VSVLQLYTEHRIGQWLDHRTFEHDGIFLGLGQVTLLNNRFCCYSERTGGAGPERGGLGCGSTTGDPRRDLAQNQRIILPQLADNSNGAR
jgi:hypothetical protein